MHAIISEFTVFCFVFHRLVQQQVKPALDKLKADADIDVQYYAVEALDGGFTNGLNVCPSFSLWIFDIENRMKWNLANFMLLNPLSFKEKIIWNFGNFVRFIFFLYIILMFV